MSIGLALALSVAPVTMSFNSVNVITQVTLTPKELRERRRRDAKIARLCRSALHHRDALASLGADADSLSKVAERLWHGELGCRKNPDLAIAVLRFATGGDRLTKDAEIVALLAQFLDDRGNPADRAELLDLEGILWVRGQYYRVRKDGEPRWSPEQKRAFVARDDIWAFISAPATQIAWVSWDIRLGALRDPLSPRYAPTEAVAIMEAGHNAGDWVEAAKLLRRGQGLPRDDARADALLLRAARYVDEARLLLAPVLATRLASPDPTIGAAAALQFAPWSRAAEPGAAALRSILIAYYRVQLVTGVGDGRRIAATALTQYALADPAESDPAPVLHWIDAALSKGDAADQSVAWRSLGSLVNAGHAGADAVMNAAFVRAGGLVDGGTLRAADVLRLVSGDDYPTRAVREEQEDLVESEVVVAPDGRPLFVVVTQSRSPQLGEAVQKLVTRRFRARDILPSPGRYVRAKLPPIQFRLPACAAGTERTAAVEGALLIDSSFCPQPLPDFPIP